MKQSWYYLIAILVIMVNAVLFDIALPDYVDHTLEIQVEMLLEEKESKTSDDFTANILTSDFRDTYAFAGFYWVVPRINLLYLNSIFKPPISLHS
ncbi:MAG: hypothetical protein JXO44_11500 [Clostridia bacterium]|nr:hypothetical protein [Clostridia bacterium]